MGTALHVGNQDIFEIKMKTPHLSLFLFALIIMATPSASDAKKIKQSLKVKNKSKIENPAKTKENSSLKIDASQDSVSYVNHRGEEIIFYPEKVRFAGYDKEVNSSKESFLIINESEATLKEIAAEIIYLDMKDRMLHSRTIELKCDIPPGETRRKDIGSWDLQHTYYYYLGNEPKKVATPYKVKLQPVSFIID